MLKLKTTESNWLPFNYARAQRDHIQKTFNKYQLSLTHNIMPTTYRMPCPSKGNIPTRRNFISYTLLPRGIHLSSRSSCILAGDPLMKRGSSHDMLVCPVLFILLKGKGTSYLVGGIFLCRLISLYIPQSFHILWTLIYAT